MTTYLPISDKEIRDFLTQNPNKVFNLFSTYNCVVCQIIKKKLGIVDFVKACRDLEDGDCSIFNTCVSSQNSILTYWKASENWKKFIRREMEAIHTSEEILENF